MNSHSKILYLIWAYYLAYEGPYLSDFLLMQNYSAAAETILLAFQNYILVLGTSVMIPTLLVPLMGGSDVSVTFSLILSCLYYLDTNSKNAIDPFYLKSIDFQNWICEDAHMFADVGFWISWTTTCTVLSSTNDIHALFVFHYQGDKARVIQTLLFVAGLNTLLQALFGTRLPAVVGGSFAYVIPIFYIINDSSLRQIEEPHVVVSQS